MCLMAPAGHRAVAALMTAAALSGFPVPDNRKDYQSHDCSQYQKNYDVTHSHASLGFLASMYTPKATTASPKMNPITLPKPANMLPI